MPAEPMGLSSGLWCLMAEVEPPPTRPDSPELECWRGGLGFVLLATVGMMGPDITPTVYFPNLDHYIPRYVLLALSVGLGLSAVRSGKRLERVFGLAVLIAGLGMVAYIIRACLRIVPLSETFAG